METTTALQVGRAFKAFRVGLADDAVYLVSATTWAIWWPQPDGTWRLRARCLRGCTDIPDKWCACGIYGAYDLNDALEFGGFVGVVRPVGKTLPAKYGWRAEAAVVELLSAPPEIIPDLPPQLRERLCPHELLQAEVQVPVRATRRAAPREAPPSQNERRPEPRLLPVLQVRVEEEETMLSVRWGSTFVVRRYRYGNPCADWWYSREANRIVMHRDDGPAVIEYEPNGRPCREEWYRKGRVHREDGPAVVVRYHGHWEYRAWYRDGRPLWTEGGYVNRKEEQ